MRAIGLLRKSDMSMMARPVAARAAFHSSYARFHLIHRDGRRNRFYLSN
jgi:hypothetical protein